LLLILPAVVSSFVDAPEVDTNADVDITVVAPAESISAVNINRL